MSGTVKLLLGIGDTPLSISDLEEFQCTTAYSLDETLSQLESGGFDALVLERGFMADRCGEVLEQLRETAPGTAIIVLCGEEDPETEALLVKGGVQECLLKPRMSRGLLVKTVHYALERHRLKLELEKETGQLKQREEQLIEIINAEPDGVLMKDTRGAIRFMNPAARDILGRDIEAFPGLAGEWPRVPGERREIEIKRNSGDSCIIEMRITEIDWEGGQASLTYLRELTGERELMARWSEEKERLDVTLGSIADGVIAVDENGMIRIINWVAGEMTGWLAEDAVGRHIGEVMKLKNYQTGQELKDPSSSVLDSCKIIGGVHSGGEDWWLVSRIGKEVPVEYTCAPIRRGDNTIGSVLVLRDVTEKRAMDAEMMKAQNLEALGILAGGLAHEFNNVLTSTLGYLSMAKNTVEKDTEMWGRLKKAVDAALRAKEISDQLLHFSKGGEPSKERGFIMEALKEAAEEILHEPGIEIEWHMETEPGELEFDNQQLRLTFRNILHNAVEAMNETGTVDVYVKNAIIDRIHAKMLNIKPGRYIEIKAVDQGIGINRDDLPRIFAPYFSTKDNHEGLGLTTAYSIVRRHGGTIKVQNVEPKGCMVSVLLPGLHPVDKEGITVPVPGKAVKKGNGEKIRVLVMDDEESVRDILREMLGFLDYEPVMAESGEEALELYRAARESGAPIDIVILDLVVPTGMGGKECMEHLLEMDPDVRAIVSSGYSHDPVMSAFEKHGFLDVLPKPYKIQDLSSVLEQFDL